MHLYERSVVSAGFLSFRRVFALVKVMITCVVHCFGVCVETEAIVFEVRNIIVFIVILGKFVLIEQRCSVSRGFLIMEYPRNGHRRFSQ